MNDIYINLGFLTLLGHVAFWWSMIKPTGLENAIKVTAFHGWLIWFVVALTGFVNGIFNDRPLAEILMFGAHTICLCIDLFLSALVRNEVNLNKDRFRTSSISQKRLFRH